MSNNQDRYPEWVLAPPSSFFEEHFKTHPHHTKYISEFETDVTTNPFRHRTRKKITPLEGKQYPAGYHRYRKRDLRITYYADKTDHTVYPLDAATAGGARYKKRG